MNPLQRIGHRLALSLPLVLLVGAPAALATPADPLRVAVVVGLQPGAINIPTIELYRAVTDNVALSSAWKTAGRSRDLKPLLKAPAELAGLGSIPAFDRTVLLAAQAGAKAGRAGKRKSRVVAPVQAMLDALDRERQSGS